MEELQWWISLHPFHIREHKHQSSPWVKPREWLDFELIWHLASHFATTSHTFSESKAKFAFNFCNRELSCWQESCPAWADVRGQIPELAHSHLQLSWPGKCWQNFNLRLFIVPSTPTTQGFPSVLPWRLWVPAVCTYSWNTLADFGAVPGLWKPSFFSIHNIHENVCFSCYHLDPELHGKRRKKTLTSCWRINSFSLPILSLFLPTQLPDFNFMATIRAGALYMLWSEPVVG